VIIWDQFHFAKYPDAEAPVDASRLPRDKPTPPSNQALGPVGEATGSVTQWIGDLKAGDRGVVQSLWDRYFSQLVERARMKLCALHSPMAVNDEEDVALSAFHSLCEGVRQGRFPRLDDRDDLWQILVHLTACKAVDQHRRERRQKRGGGGVRRESDMLASASDDGQNPLDRLIGSEPSPEFAAMVAEEYRRRIESLGEPTLRLIAERKLACCTNDEIAQELGVSLRTVTLKLELIRKRWKEDGETP
jgi:DNA-directed RNA polymerase specialized sigma24 family protein